MVVIPTRIAAVVVVTLIFLVVMLFAAMYVVVKGPSTSARDLFVMSVKETSAMGFLADIYLSEEEIAEITSVKATDLADTDTTLISFPTSATDVAGSAADAWGLVDDDGDGIILDKVNGEGYSGYMMVVLDPSRVVMGSVPESYGKKGYTVEEMVGQFDAVAGVNAGGFYDPNGQGNGSIPDSMVVVDGVAYYAEKGCREGFAGMDSKNILHVGMMTAKQAEEQDIQSGVSFGPVLISNGKVVLPEGATSGLNPRTAIGQRSDGAILLLVIDGRQVVSLGATFGDLVEIFTRYGAVNAINLDGGSSTLMWYKDGYVNNCASVIGIRPIPTSFLVLREGADTNE